MSFSRYDSDSDFDEAFANAGTILSSFNQYEITINSLQKALTIMNEIYPTLKDIEKKGTFLLKSFETIGIDNIKIAIKCSTELLHVLGGPKRLRDMSGIDEKRIVALRTEVGNLEKLFSHLTSESLCAQIQVIAKNVGNTKVAEIGVFAEKKAKK